ncbi:TonB-dependent receptor [Hufsiella ginkgonis]|uniref:TonB-dependent receptor plug domain-containing protein n=1 Tax=Hufsiella ginkgonis TaxID=2695274 RepID=A0A7K1XTJ5_9SPHI|nr:TonB-dependent receptor [Hufsiella ginkgonis]MXV14089.1 TonB-dependent receptor plug domain-containing protein [Hufsiella ginkgonis]
MIKHLFPLFSLICCLLASPVLAQQRFTVSGTVRDAASGETLIGATVKLTGTATSAMSTNAYGFYSLSGIAGEYVLSVTYTGYELYTKKITLNASQKADLALSPAGTTLQEIRISAADRKDQNVRTPQMGIDKLNMAELDNLPVLFGEKDVLKTIQLLPGVKSGGEGTTGFFVRGGAADQNLILLDEATVYNSSHLLGFFSTFNADAIKDVSLYKGGMPAQYGGRLSSVLDVKMQDGNNQQFGAEGGIGLIASRVKAEGPIVKNRGSFMVSARRTYIDLLLKASPDSSISGNTLNFYDLNAKLNYRFNDKNTLYASGYFGQDNIGIRDLFANDWGNTTATVRLNHVFNSRLFSNTSFIFNKYRYAIELLDEDNNARITSLIRDYNIKEDLQFYSNHHTVRFGLQATHHRISPSEITASEGSIFNPLKIESRYGMEVAGYASDEWALSEKLSLLYGVRVSAFSLLGPGTIRTFDQQGNETAANNYKSGDVVKSYVYPEPRFSASYILNERSSLKASYNRNTQNIHVLTNASTSSPTDQYVMSSNNIKPGIADQAAIGYFRNAKDNSFEFSVETYYKWLKNQIDYRDGAELIGNGDVESELLYGVGRAYGLEFYAKKTAGKLTGWISYTLSKTERKFDDINRGQYFPSRQDRTHDVSLVGMYNTGKRWTFSANYIYNTGNAVTFPAGKYDLDGLTTYYYTERNANRMPYTSRLDVSATLKAKETKKLRSSWSFGLYNALNRKNPYAIQFRDKENDPTRTEAVQISLFGIIPSVTWNFKF